MCTISIVTQTEKTDNTNQKIDKIEWELAGVNICVHMCVFYPCADSIFGL